VHPWATLVRVKPPASALVDLYDPTEVVFRKSAGGLEYALGQVASEGRLVVHGAPGTIIRVRGLQNKVDAAAADPAPAPESLSTTVPPGDYRITLEERGQVLATQTITVKPGERVDIDMLADLGSPLRAAILAHVAPQGGRAIAFSESLGGPTADLDLGLWLAWLGASRIMGRKGEFSELDRVPLDYRFEGLRPGAAPLYVLAGFEGPPAEYAIGVGRTPQWTAMQPVTGVPGLFEFFRPCGSGPLLVSFQAAGRPPITVSTHALSNRATFLVLTAGGDLSPIRLYQCLLPIGGLMDQLPQPVRERVQASPLAVTRTLVEVERLFSARQAISDAPALRNEWHDLIHVKWLDPIASLIAANDLLRRGVLNPKGPLAEFRGVLPEMVQNFRTYFGQIPDVEAFAKSIGLPYTVPTAAPMLADSLAAFSLEEQRKFMPFANDVRHFGTPWVAWVNAVDPHFPLNRD
jgi:hypothetical protein